MHDVIVIGAGLAGLAAARMLVRNGHTVRVVEARDRVGGRTLSEKIGRATFDLGGQWIGPTQHRMLALVQELGIEIFPTFSTGKKLLDVDGSRSTYEGDIPKMPMLALLEMHFLLGRIDKLLPTVSPHDADLDGITLAQWQRDTIRSKRVRGALDAAVRVVFGAEPEQISLLHFLLYAQRAGGFRPLIDIEGGAQQWRFAGGAQLVARRLASDLGERVTTGAPARHVDQRGETVLVHTDVGTFEGRHVVVAVPPHLAGRIRFSPELPPAREHFLQRAPMGATVKVIAAYDRPFWRHAGWSGEVVCNQPPVSLVFDNSSHDGAQPALLAFVVGNAARRFAGPGPVLEALGSWFGPEALSPTEVAVKNWGDDPWAGGCPTTAYAPGVLSLFPGRFDPIGRVHFAGTETATAWCGFLEGAVQSGERAARAIMGES